MSNKGNENDIDIDTGSTASSVEEACSLGILERLAEEYILSCCTSKTEEKEETKEEIGRKKQNKKDGANGERSKFPNVAGFCRYFGIGRRRYEQLSKRYPDEFEKITAVFEDEALNSQISPSLISSYLKRRLGYTEDTDTEERSSVDTGAIRLIFDHDILKDGE